MALAAHGTHGAFEITTNARGGSWLGQDMQRVINAVKAFAVRRPRR
jgi:hypothetical protein